MNFIKSNLWEIDRSPLMKHLGALLSVLHIINYFYWVKFSSFVSSGGKPLLCWEFMPNCANLSTNHPTLMSWIFSFYLIFACVAFLTFLIQRLVGLAWTSLLIANIVALLFYILDASLSSDVLSLILFLNIGFLFVPNKAPLVRWSIVIFYLVSAFLELSPEWLSGVSLHDKLPLSYKALEWVSAFGVVVKVTLPFLLLSPIGQRLALGVCGLIFYHSFNFYIFHDFTSLALIVLNLYFIFDYFVTRQMEREALYQSYAHPEPSKLWWPIAMLIYILIQTPMLDKNNITDIFRISGPKKTFECTQITFAKFKNRIEQVSSIMPTDLSAQLKCHPLIAFNSAREYCDKIKTDSDFIALTSHFLLKSLADKEFHQIFAVANICGADVRYKKSVEYQ